MDYIWTVKSFDCLKTQRTRKWLVSPRVKTSPALAKPQPKALLIVAVSETGSGPDAPNDATGVMPCRERGNT